ncbi:MAG TPA: hypothetical protein VGE04_19980 [Chloroflexia bacterium]|jgi:hypothetical protein
MALCIPHATAVPGLAGPPNWFDNSAPAANPLRTQIDDPRWIGSYSQGFGYGTAEEATFRALNHTVGTQTYLYLSWHVKYENTPSPLLDTLYVGLTRTGHPPLILKVKPYGNPGNVDLEAVPAADIAAGSRNAADGKLTAFFDVPDWITDTLRCWHYPGSMDWAVHLRVPIKAGASLEDNDGIDLPATFKMWYCYDIYTPTRADAASTTGITGGVLRLLWPSNTALGFSGGAFVYPDPNSASAPWLEYNNGSSAAPCSTSTGIALVGYTSIGTNTPGIADSQISTTIPNTFYAQPTNNSGSTIAISALKARFRLANWGAVCDPLAPWSTIGEADNNALINNGTTAPNNVVNLTWSTPASFVAAMSLPPADPNYKSSHQCILVELSGVGLTFTASSRYRNMDFVPNSTYSRQAEINVVGLKPVSIANRDTYLAVEALNMPPRSDVPPRFRLRPLGPEAVEAGGALTNMLRDDQRDRIQVLKDFVANYYAEGLDKQYNVPVEDLLDANLPTYRVHTYYDTGERQTTDGNTYAILGLGSSFGYYGVTAFGAEVEGWEHRLEGAIRIAENFYLLRVPNNGKAYVTTTLQSLAPGEQPLPQVPIERWPDPTPAIGSGVKGCLSAIIDFIMGLFKRSP